jgi:hypothetical protein
VVPPRSNNRRSQIHCLPNQPIIREAAQSPAPICVSDALALEKRFEYFVLIEHRKAKRFRNLPA